LQATLEDNGISTPVPDAAWSVTNDTGSATVSAGGILTGKTVGKVTLTATKDANTATVTAYVVSPTPTITLSVPSAEMTAGTSFDLPIILSSSPNLTDLSVNLKVTSTDPTAPALLPSAIHSPDGATVVSSGATADGYSFQIHWATAVHGPLTAATATFQPPANLASDTPYQVQISGFTLTPAPPASGPSLVSQGGTLFVHVAQPGPITQITVNPSQATVGVNQTVRFLAMAKDANGNQVPNSPVAWSVTPNGFGTIDPDTGVFKATAAGDITITATSGAASGSSQVTVTSGPATPPDLLVVPTVSGPADTDVVVPVLLAPLSNLAGVAFNVKVVAPDGASPLTILDPETGPLASAAFLSDNMQADGTLAVAMLSAKPIQGPGTLLQLHFKTAAGVADGTRYAIQLTNLDFSDDRAQPIEGSAYAGALVIGSGTPPTKLGDVNQDGGINVADAVLTLKSSVGLVQLTDNQKAAADINKDAQVNVADAVMILKIAIGIIPPPQ
jgi:hypothetical protein